MEYSVKTCQKYICENQRFSTIHREMVKNQNELEVFEFCLKKYKLKCIRKYVKFITTRWNKATDANISKKIVLKWFV